MFLAKMMFISLGLLMVILGLLVWKKRMYNLIAGYVEGIIKDENTYGKVNGMILIMIGMITIIFNFFIEVLHVWVFLVLIIVPTIAQIVLNVRMANK